MPITVQVEATVKPERLDAFIAMCKQGFPDTRAFDGCNGLQAYLHENGGTLLVIEDWDSKEHYLKYHAWRTETGVMAAMGTFLQKPLEIRYFSAIDA